MQSPYIVCLPIYVCHMECISDTCTTHWLRKDKNGSSGDGASGDGASAETAADKPGALDGRCIGVPWNTLVNRC